MATVILGVMLFAGKAEATYPLPANFCHTFTNDLTLGDTDYEVGSLRQILASQGFLSSNNVSSHFFDNDVRNAVIAFQQKYASDILTPNKLTRSTGTIGQSSRAKLNSLYACAVPTPSPSPTPVVTLPPTIIAARVSPPVTLSQTADGIPTRASVAFSFVLLNNNDDPLYISKNADLAFATLSNLDSAAASYRSIWSPTVVSIQPSNSFYIGPKNSRAFSESVILDNRGNPQTDFNGYVNISRIFYATTPNIQSFSDESYMYTNALQSGPIRLAP